MIRCRDGILGWFTSHMLQVLTYGYVSGSPPKAFYNIWGSPANNRNDPSATLPNIMVWAPFGKPKNRLPGPQRKELIPGHHGLRILGLRPDQLVQLLTRLHRPGP